MKKRWTFVNLLALGLLLTLTVSLSQAQGPDSEGEPPPDDLSIAAAVGEKISYQGMLTENGTPVDGQRPMVFKLYSNNGCTTLVDTIDAGNVQVNDGLFDVVLNVDQDDFNGQGLWLKVEVDGTGVGCEEIVPAPYALSLRPGAKIKGAPGLAGALVEASVEDGSIKGSLVQGLLLTGAGVYGSTSSSLAYGVYGSNSAGGYAGYFDSDVGQSRTADGLVKAAVYAYCADSSGSYIHRSFNAVNTNSITISSGASAGKCTIDFNFDINDRFWSASSYGLVAQGVSCQQGTSNDKLDCYRWSTAPAGVDGSIMVVVY